MAIFREGVTSLIRQTVSSGRTSGSEAQSKIDARRPGTDISPEYAALKVVNDKMRRALAAEKRGHAETARERDQLAQRVHELEASQAAADDTRTCPQCGRSYPDGLANWPGYLIEGETRCAVCYGQAT